MEELGGATLAAAVRAHGGEVTCVAACGARLASGGGDRALRLWLWAPGAGWQARAEARAAHRYGVTAAAWAPAGALLASGGVDGVARLWCGRSLAARRALAAPGAGAVRSLCWLGGGGARLAVGHDDGAACVWAPAPGTLLARLAAHENALHALVSLARDSLLLTACTDGVLKLYDLAEVCCSGAGVTSPARGVSALQQVDGAHDLGALCAAASEDGRAAATGGHDASVRLWSVCGARLRPAGALEGHAAAVTALRWCRHVLGSCSLDRTARLWAPARRACLHVLRGHERYLTCLALDPRLRYVITGSNDRTVRTWALGSFSVDEELEPPCDPREHFALGDLEGIGPAEEEEGEDEAAAGQGAGEAGDGCVWREAAHGGAINCIAASGDLLATASSDGTVKVWRWEEAARRLRLEHALEAHRYPALAVDFGADGAVLLSAGLDGCALLWDVDSGVVLRSLSVPCGGGGAGGETGGGGVRGARVAAGRVLLATDDGLAPVWPLADTQPHPAQVYAGHAEAVTCCAWSTDGRLAATGAASGELRLLAPPAPHRLHHDSQAHDLGVLSCDFAPPCDDIELPAGGYLLATAGCDSLIKLWSVLYRPEEAAADVRLLRAVAAHGGGVASVRWAAGAALLVSAGADEWARAWRVRVRGGEACVRGAGGAHVRGAGGALAAAALRGGELLAAGALSGELLLWRPSGAAPGDREPGEDDVAPRLWSEEGVARWLREYVLNPAARSGVGRDLAGRVRAARVTGARLLDDDVDALLPLLGFDDGDETGGGSAEEAELRARLRSELEWLRRAPLAAAQEERAPHWARCPLSHAVLVEPARAADGYTYERANLREWLLAAPPEGATSPMSGRRLRSARLAPNYKLRDRLRAFLAADGADPADPGEPPDLSGPAEPPDPTGPAEPPDLIDLSGGESSSS